MNNKLKQRFLPSEPCSCDTCRDYCKRPGWWTVEEAEKVIESDFSDRMMLEISPERDFGVLSPAFKGNEGGYALQIHSKNDCTFLKNGLCELFNTGLQPLECRYCHHDRKGQGQICHDEIEKDWQTNEAKRIIVRWGNKTGFWRRQGFNMVEK